MELTHVTDQTFDTEVLDSDKPVLVDFWADWCNPCRMVEPHVKAIAEQYPDRVRVVKLNLDENPRVAGKYGVMSIPTMMLFVDGAEKTRVVGARPKDAIWSELEPFI
ncbi:MAG: thioredoxin [Actinomycetota bacterium]|nr:thioredoxin [Actinomycetota bacterium]